MKIRIKFAKTGSMKFIGHLDTMRFFQKLIRLSGIDIRYSEGFSPHQIMSFALPLGVGVESVGEYMDIDVLSTFSSEEALLRLNQNMPEGLKALSYRRLPEDAKNAMSLVSLAEYVVEPREGDFSGMQQEIDLQFHEKESFLIKKKTKKSEKELDLKRYVRSFFYRDNAFYLKLSAGSETNIKPELLLAPFLDRTGRTYAPAVFRTIRQELFAGNEADGYATLESMGEEID